MRRRAFVASSVALGLAPAFPPGGGTDTVGRIIADQLFNVKPYDPISLAVAVSVLALAAAIAGLIPAARAASIEPMEALRTE